MQRSQQISLDRVSCVSWHPTSAVMSNRTPAASQSVELSVDPVSCQQDDPVSIRVSGLVPSEDVTLQASMKDVRGVHFHSHAHYRADSSGQVDVRTMKSLGGHYKGIFPMGLIGCLSPAPNEYKFTRFFKRDVENPNIVKVTAHKGHLSDKELCSDVDEPLATVTHLRHYMAPGVQRLPVRYGKVRGCLFLPPGDGPFPGVVDMFGTAGGLLEYRSAQLASRGFASLALAFFNYEDLPKTLKEFDVAYFEEAVEFLLKHEKVLHHGVGVIGTSKGGDLALSMATFIPSVHVCVAINCYNAPVGVSLKVRDHIYPPLKFSNIDGVRISDDGGVNVLNSSSDPRKHPESALPIEQSQAAFLFMVGSDDRNTKSEFYAQLACQRLSEHGYSKCYEVSSHPGTGHLLEPPYSPHCFASFQHTYMLPVIWGGTAKHHTIGQEKAWSKMREFLWVHLMHNRNMCSETASKCSCTPKCHL